jgi:nucleoside-diphosphate-sugar epimerase
VDFISDVFERERPTHICHLAARAGTECDMAMNISEHSRLQQSVSSFRALKETAYPNAASTTVLKCVVLVDDLLWTVWYSLLVVVLMAGVRASIEDPYIYVHSNVEGTTRLLDLARLYCCKNFVYASSSSVYGYVCFPS